MKIKEVCEKTGLTDKAIRHYIANGLVFPEYNENYTGRKSFDFSDEDIIRLNQIAILRKYRFTIKSIKELIDDEIDLPEFVNSHLEELTLENDENARIIENLEQLCEENISLTEFCKRLDTLDEGREIPTEDSLPPYKQMYEVLRKYSLAFECGAAIAIIILFAVLLTVSDGFLDLFLNAFIIERVNELSELLVIGIMMLEIIGIVISYCFIQKNSEKRFRHLMITELLMTATGTVIISVITRLWLALIICVILFTIIYFQEKKLRDLEIKNQKEQGIFDRAIDISKYRLTVPKLLTSAAVGIALSKIIPVIVEKTILHFFE